MNLEEQVSNLTNQVRALQDLIRRHSHDGIETDKLELKAIKPGGNVNDVITSNGSSLAPTWQKTSGISASPSVSASLSPSASSSSSSSASLSPSSSASASV